MKITDIKVRRVFDEGFLRAVVSITIDKVLAIHEIKIVDNGKHRFVAMPSRSFDDGSYHDIVHPVGADSRKAIEKIILDAFDSYMATINHDISA